MKNQTRLGRKFPPTAKSDIGNRSGRKTLDAVARDPRVIEVWSEGPDGYWASLKPGFNWQGCSTIHEWRCDDLIARLKDIERGDPY